MPDGLDRIIEAPIRPGEVGHDEPVPAIEADPERQLLGQPVGVVEAALLRGDPDLILE